MILVALAALLVAALATAAYARDFTCKHTPCNGTEERDSIFERTGNGVDDVIYGKRGADVIDASLYTNDVDILYGGRGADTLDTDDGDSLDTVRGQKGDDTCYIDAGDTAFNCETLYIDGMLQT